VGRHPLDWLRPHLWTLAPRLRHMVRPESVPPAEPWQATVEDPVVGRVRLSGLLRRESASGGEDRGGGKGPGGGDDQGGDEDRGGGKGRGGGEGRGGDEERGGGVRGGSELVVLVHGLGGTVGSHYMLRGARAARAAGLSCLRLNLRGADCSGEDFYHAGLTADLHAALASPDLRRYRRIYLLGYSLGGHLVLRYATEAGDPRVVAAAAVCSPLDLGRAQEAIDAPGIWLYRRYLISNLTQVYAAVAARRPMPLAVSAVAKMRRLRDFDEHVVAPRHGFTGAADYYARASVAPLLGALRLPSLLVNAVGDPMVRASAVRPALALPAPRLHVRWVAEGGHVGFPPGVDLALAGSEPPEGAARVGERLPVPPAIPLAPAGRLGPIERRPPAPMGVDGQVIAWLRQQ
jgi:predicted alpha/beta-fold hydrolase